MAHGGEEPPTRPVRPIEPRDPVARETVTTAEPGWAAGIEDAIRSLRTLAGAALALALVAGGLAVWSLTRSDGEDSGASATRVSSLDDRVDRLERQVGDAEPADLEERIEDRATKGDLEKLTEDVEELRTQVRDTSEGGQDSEARDAVEALDQRVTDLAEEVESLRSEQGETP